MATAVFVRSPSAGHAHTFSRHFPLSKIYFPVNHCWFYSKPNDVNVCPNNKSNGNRTETEPNQSMGNNIGMEHYLLKYTLAHQRKSISTPSAINRLHFISTFFSPAIPETVYFAANAHRHINIHRTATISLSTCIWRVKTSWTVKRRPPTTMTS